MENSIEYEIAGGQIASFAVAFRDAEKNGNVLGIVRKNVEEIGNEVTDQKICKVDVDENPELARQYRVMSIPTLAVFKEGEMVKREVGAKSKGEILEMLK